MAPDPDPGEARSRFELLDYLATLVAKGEMSAQAPSAREGGGSGVQGRNLANYNHVFRRSQG